MNKHHFLFFKIFIVFIIFLNFQGCVSQNDRNNISKKLKANEYIPSEWGFVELKYSIKDSIMYDIAGYNYIYMDEDKILYNVAFPSEIDENCTIYIYCDVYKTTEKDKYNKNKEIEVYKQHRDGNIIEIPFEYKRKKHFFGLITFGKWAVANNKENIELTSFSLKK